MQISIDTIHDNPSNARHIEATFEDDDLLAQSLAALGMLQPVLVCPHPDRPGEWLLRAGHRRVRAARRLKWKEVPAVEGSAETREAPETAVSAAENMVRRRMHPVDQWRAIVDLQRENAHFTLEQAAAACGVPLSLARQMSILGSMAEEVIEALAKEPELPAMHTLRTIAIAPVEVQQKAMAAERGEKPEWYDVANRCTIKRIPMKRAIFDTKKMAWDEDAFAQPEAEDRFTTSDIEAFVELQRAALVAQCKSSDGRYVLSSEDRTGAYRVKIPKGYMQEYGPVPKRFQKSDPRVVFCAVCEDNTFRLGSVDYAMARPKKEVSEDGLLDDQAETAPTINKTTLELIAKMKAEAVRERLRVFKGNGAIDMLRAILMLFTMNNVRAGNMTGSAYGVIAHSLVMPDGQPRDDVDEEELCSMAAWVIEQAIAFDHPKSVSGSGKGAEWLAVAIGAEMPRMDTKEILRGVSTAKLEEIAPQQSISTLRNPAGLRKAMVGMMPNWRLVEFGAPGPIADTAQDVGE